MTEHIEELAELYALGSLDDLERLRVERHVSQCAICAARLHQAEETVTAVAEAQPLHAPPARLQERLHRSIKPARRWPQWQMWPAAVAAILVLALFFVILNLLVDIAQAAIDPRIKRG